MEGFVPLGKMSEIEIKSQGDAICIGPVKLYPNRVTFDKSATLEDGRLAGIYVQRNVRSNMWSLGDWSLAMETKFGEESAQYVSAEHFSEDILKRARWVCDKIEPSRRVAQLSFEHHAAVAGIETKDQDKWLRRAADKGLSVQDLRRGIRQKAHKDRYIEQDLPEGRFRVIYADFPWSFDDHGVITDSDAYNKAERHYPPMSDDEIREFCGQIKEIAARDCVLALWAPVPRMAFAMEVIEECGFIFKTEFIWHKVNPETGNQQNTASHYNGLVHENLLIATRGKMTPDMETAHQFKSVQVYPRVVDSEGDQVHSRKPEEFRTILDTLWPTVTKTKADRIELFARYKADGWAQFGNEQVQGDGKAAAANDAPPVVEAPEAAAPRLVRSHHKRKPTTPAEEPAAATA